MSEPRSYQRLTTYEYRQLASLAEHMKRWRTVAWKIREYYGSRARFVIVERAHEIEHVPFHFEVQDDMHHPCPVDVTLPWYDAGKRGDPHNLSDLSLSNIEGTIHLELQFEDPLPSMPAIYDLQCPPTVGDRDPELYILRPDWQDFVPFDLETAMRGSRWYQADEHWHQINQCARRMYGSAACFVSITTVFRDSGEEVIESFQVRDEQHHVMAPDVTLAWYAEWLAAQNPGRQQELSHLTLEEVQEEIKEEVEASLLVTAGLPVVAAECDLRYQPRQRYIPDLYRPTDAPFLPLLSGTAQIVALPGKRMRRVILRLDQAYWWDQEAFPHLSAQAHSLLDPKNVLEPTVVHGDGQVQCTFLLEPLSLVELFMINERGDFHCVYCLLDQHLATVQQEGMEIVDAISHLPLASLSDSLVTF